MCTYSTYPTPSAKTINEIVQHYHRTLTEQQVHLTLTKLAVMHCLEIVGRDVTITQTGSKIV